MSNQEASKKLVEILRETAAVKPFTPQTFGQARVSMKEAADEIERLQKRVAELERSLDYIRWADASSAQELRKVARDTMEGVAVPPFGALLRDLANALEQAKECETAFDMRSFVIDALTMIDRERGTSVTKSAICKSCSQEFDLSEGHKCPGITGRAGEKMAALNEKFKDRARGDDYGEIDPRSTHETSASREVCEDCPPAGHPTDDTRCLECPRRPAPL